MSILTKNITASYSIRKFVILMAAVAQLAERRIVVPNVTGSSPVGRPSLSLYTYSKDN
jgi:hypothetical protein